MLQELIMSSYSLLAIFSLCVAGGLAYDGFLINKGSPNDRGIVKNCADAKHNFTGWWEPRILVVGKLYNVNFDFTPVIGWKSGSFEGTVWLASDPTPIYKTTMPVSCGQIKKYIKCPLTKGGTIKFLLSNIPFRLPYAFPAGKYKLRAEIKDNQGKILICAEVTIQLAGSSNDMDFGGNDKL